jgi:molybdate transport system substrate-binding protein
MPDPLRFFASAMALLLALAACTSPPQTAPQTGPTVLAASSLTEAFEEVADLWAAQGHARPVLSFAGTPALARQVESGAPADLVVFADSEWMDGLAQAGLIDPASRRNLLSNRLMLIQPKDAAVVTLETLGDGRLALADPDSVPAGRYARAALETMGLWPDLADNVVPTENVRAALALVERGEVELGIVYVSDARASDGVSQVQFLPEASYPPIRYPAAIVTGSTHPDSAAFNRYLQSDAAMAVFVAHGFERPR